MRNSILFRSCSLALLSLCVSACGLKRFNELREDTPVVELDTPKNFQGQWGSTLASLRTDEDNLLLVMGGQGTFGASYELGVSESPVVEPVSKAFCTGENLPCFGVGSPAGMASARSPSGMLLSGCFVAGVGETGSGSGLWLRCLDDWEIEYDIPDSLEPHVLQPVLNGTLPDIVFTTADKALEPYLLAGVPDERAAFYYPPLERAAVLLEAPQASASFGASLAVARDGGRALLAVGAPEAGELSLYSAEGETSALLGCISGEEGFSRSLSAGDLDGDGVEDLAVSDEERVRVYSGADLLALSSGDTCADEGSLGLTPLVEVACSTDENTDGCAFSDFGRSTAIADLDGDGSGELAVGAPDLRARDVASAGAVLIYSAGGDLLDTRLLSNAKEGEQFGGALEKILLDDREVLISASPGENRVQVVYCYPGVPFESPRCATSAPTD